MIVFDEYGPVRMIRSRDWKYIHRYPYGPHEFYDLTNDPDEAHNLIDSPDHQARIATNDFFLASGVKEACQDAGVPMRQPEEGDLFLACCDALIAAQTAVLAAEALGVGSCYIGDIMENYEIHRPVLLAEVHVSHLHGVLWISDKSTAGT